MNIYLSIDIGTSSTKLSLFAADGRLIASRSASHAVDYPRPEWAEQDPEEWWRAVCQVAPQIMPALGADRLSGISVSGQTPLCVPVDEAGRPLRKAILWLDRRATGQVEWLHAQIGEEHCRRVSANRLDSYFGGPKWLWFKQNEPELFHRTWKILQANGYIILKLANRAVIDPAQAGLCSPCFNFARRDWDEELCRAMGIPPGMLPEVHPTAEVIGAVTAEAARQTGLTEGTPLVCGGADFACSCLGAGVTGQGEMGRRGDAETRRHKDTGTGSHDGEGLPSFGAVERGGGGALMLGTAGNLLFPGMESSGPDGLPDSRLLHTIHLTGQPLPFGGVFAGGNLSWFAGLFGSAGTAGADPHLFARLDEEAARVPAGSEGLVFLPYLMGERTPIWDPGARGAFVGLSSRHGRAHLYRAILEGIAFAFRQIAEIVEAGQRESALQSITAIDGGARSPLWRQIFADILNRPIHQGSERSGTALGSAFLAALGTGGLNSFEDISAWVEIASVTQPAPAAVSRYDEIYPIYKGLYPKLKTDFEKLA